MTPFRNNRTATLLYVFGLATFMFALLFKDAHVPAIHAIAGFCLGISMPLLLASLWRSRHAGLGC